MNRKEREIKDFAEIYDVLKRCKTIRLGLINGDKPYVVPVSFGLDIADGKAVVYFHGAVEGLKAECIAENGSVCIEADIFYKVDPTKIGITARYESVIGCGVVSRVEGEEKLHGLHRLVEHYGFDDYPIERCRGLEHTAVYKIVITELTGKRNLPDSD